MRPLDPSSGRVLLAELLGLLPPPGRLKCLVMLACLEPDDPRLLLRLGALRPERTRRAILPREPRLENLAVLRIGVGQPGDALFACRAGHDLPLPVDLEAPLVEARAGASLPARVLGHRADVWSRRTRAGCRPGPGRRCSPCRPSAHPGANHAAPATHAPRRSCYRLASSPAS